MTTREDSPARSTLGTIRNGTRLLQILGDGGHRRPGELAGLAPIHVFTGTDDVLNPDARRLAHTMAEKGQEVHLHEAEGMQHCYALLPLIPEGKAARKAIIGIMRAAGP